MLKVSRAEDSINTGFTKSAIESRLDGIDYSEQYDSLLRNYNSTGEVVEVDFRKLVHFRSGVDRYTHLIHPYPAKLLLNIPYFFINCRQLSKPNGTILDPFCGSGTVLLEAILAGRDAIGADANPLARLIAECKTSVEDTTLLKNTLNAIVEKSKLGLNKVPPQNILNWSHWYTPQTIKQLSILKASISEIKNKRLRQYFEMCFSLTAKKVSFSDPSVSVPVKLNPERFEHGSQRRVNVENLIKKIEKSNVIDVFKSITENNVNRTEKLSKEPSLGKLIKVCEDSRNLIGILDNSVDLIITSPPYAGAQKYIRSSSLGIGWLGLTEDQQLRTLEKKNIGREHYNKAEYSEMLIPPVKSAYEILEKVRKQNPLRSHIASKYLEEMKDALKESYRVLKSGGHLIIVIGNNVVCGEEFDTRQYMEELCTDLRFQTELVLRDEINSRGLMTKRNKTASVIACEWIMVFKKY